MAPLGTWHPDPLIRPPLFIKILDPPLLNWRQHWLLDKKLFSPLGSTPDPVLRDLHPNPHRHGPRWGLGTQPLNQPPLFKVLDPPLDHKKTATSTVADAGTDRRGVEFDRAEYEMVRLPAAKTSRIHDLPDDRPRVVQPADVRLAVA